MSGLFSSVNSFYNELLPLVRNKERSRLVEIRSSVLKQEESALFAASAHAGFHDALKAFKFCGDDLERFYRGQCFDGTFESSAVVFREVIFQKIIPECLTFARHVFMDTLTDRDRSEDENEDALVRAMGPFEILISAQERVRAINFAIACVGE